MVKVAKHISNLLYCHDCVILPEFGGFIANYKAAKIDAVTKTATPPSKSISFNKFLTHNDGLLINEVSKKEVISYKEAEGFVIDYIDFCRTKLNNEKRLEIENIGLFYINNGHIHFQANQTNYSTNSFGLSPVSFKKIEKSTKEIIVPADAKPIERKAEPTKENRTKTPTLQKEREDKRTRAIPKYVLTTLAVLFLFYTAWIPLKTDVLKTGNIEVSELNPFSFDKCPTAYSPSNFYSKNKLENIVIESTETSISVEERTLTVLKEFPIKENIAESTHVEVEAKENNWKRTYYVVAGCFKEESNAIKLVEELKNDGFEAEIIDNHKGLHRVAFSKFPSRRKARELFDKIRDEGKSTWILKK